jgi:hypothetical protein
LKESIICCTLVPDATTITVPIYSFCSDRFCRHFFKYFGLSFVGIMKDILQGVFSVIDHTRKIGQEGFRSSKSRQGYFSQHDRFDRPHRPSPAWFRKKPLRSRRNVIIPPADRRSIAEHHTDYNTSCNSLSQLYFSTPSCAHEYRRLRQGDF